MKFLTKEWSQQLTKKGFLLSSPQVNPQAAAFSESFYQTLYQEAQQKRLDLMRKVAALSKKPFQAEREAEQVFQTCMDWRKQVWPQVGAQLQDRFSFHDSTVVKVERAPDRLTLFLEDGGYSPVSRVDFLSPRILEEDEGLEGAVWLYEEIHPAQGGNEYHAMLWREDDQLLYLTVFAKDLRMYEEE